MNFHKWSQANYLLCFQADKKEQKRKEQRNLQEDIVNKEI